MHVCLEQQPNNKKITMGRGLILTSLKHCDGASFAIQIRATDFRFYTLKYGDLDGSANGQSLKLRWVPFCRL